MVVGEEFDAAAAVAAQRANRAGDARVAEGVRRLGLGREEHDVARARALEEIEVRHQRVRVGHEVMGRVRAKRRGGRAGRGDARRAQRRAATHVVAEVRVLHVVDHGLRASSKPMAADRRGGAHGTRREPSHRRRVPTPDPRGGYGRIARIEGNGRVIPRGPATPRARTLVRGNASRARGRRGGEVDRPGDGADQQRRLCESRFPRARSVITPPRAMDPPPPDAGEDLPGGRWIPRRRTTPRTPPSVLLPVSPRLPGSRLPKATPRRRRRRRTLRRGQPTSSTTPPPRSTRTGVPTARRTRTRRRDTPRPRRRSPRRPARRSSPASPRRSPRSSPPPRRPRPRLRLPPRLPQRRPPRLPQRPRLHPRRTATRRRPRRPRHPRWSRGRSLRPRLPPSPPSPRPRRPRRTTSPRRSSSGARAAPPRAHPPPPPPRPPHHPPSDPRRDRNGATPPPPPSRRPRRGRRRRSR